MAADLQAKLASFTVESRALLMRAAELKHVIATATDELEEINGSLESIDIAMKMEVADAFSGHRVEPVVLPSSSAAFLDPNSGFTVTYDPPVVHVTVPEGLMDRALEEPAHVPEATPAPEAQDLCVVEQVVPSNAWAHATPAKASGSKPEFIPVPRKNEGGRKTSSAARLMKAKSVIGENLHLHMGYYRLAEIYAKNIKTGKSKVPPATWGRIKAPRFIREAHPFGYCAFAQAPEGCLKEECKLKHTCILCNQDHGAGAFVEGVDGKFEWCCEVTAAICSELKVSSVEGLHKNPRAFKLAEVLGAGGAVFADKSIREATDIMFPSMFK